MKGNDKSNKTLSKQPKHWVDADFPTKLFFAVILGIPLVVAALVGARINLLGLFIYLIVFAIMVVPIFTSFMLILSRKQAQVPSNYTFNNDKVVFKTQALKSSYKSSRIPMNILVEQFIEDNIEFNGDLLEVLREKNNFVDYSFTVDQVLFVFKRLLPDFMFHSKNQDKTQVVEHYDRGNDFYSSFLGETMIYTSAIFHKQEDNLEVAQKNKMELVCQKIKLTKGERLLDIGCGWGTFVNYTASKYGADATGVTLAKNQVSYAEGKSKELGVQSSTHFICSDYRDIPKQKWDKITCLEMAEHVGIKRFPAFLAQIKDMLVDDGVFFLQIAGLRRYWHYEDINWGLFMNKYIFPGADASCPLAWVINQLEAAGFEVHTSETIGIHYSKTITYWYNNWMKNRDYITKTYGAQLFRLWQIFLAWSVISPYQGCATCYQIVAHKNTNEYNRGQWIGDRP